MSKSRELSKLLDSTDATTMDYVISEDDMSSDSPVKIPTQRSVKRYVDNSVVGAIDGVRSAISGSGGGSAKIAWAGQIPVPTVAEYTDTDHVNLRNESVVFTSTTPLGEQLDNGYDYSTPDEALKLFPGKGYAAHGNMNSNDNAFADWIDQANNRVVMISFNGYADWVPQKYDLYKTSVPSLKYIDNPYMKGPDTAVEAFEMVAMIIKDGVIENTLFLGRTPMYRDYLDDENREFVRHVSSVPGVSDTFQVMIHDSCFKFDTQFVVPVDGSAPYTTVLKMDAGYKFLDGTRAAPPYDDEYEPITNRVVFPTTNMYWASGLRDIRSMNSHAFGRILLARFDESYMPLPSGNVMIFDAQLQSTGENFEVLKPLFLSTNDFCNVNVVGSNHHSTTVDFANPDHSTNTYAELEAAYPAASNEVFRDLITYKLKNITGGTGYTIGDVVTMPLAGITNIGAFDKLTATPVTQFDYKVIAVGGSGEITEAVVNLDGFYSFDITTVGGVTFNKDIFPVTALTGGTGTGATANIDPIVSMHVAWNPGTSGTALSFPRPKPTRVDDLLPNFSDWETGFKIPGAAEYLFGEDRMKKLHNEAMIGAYTGGLSASQTRADGRQGRHVGDYYLKLNSHGHAVYKANGHMLDFVSINTEHSHKSLDYDALKAEYLTRTGNELSADLTIDYWVSRWVSDIGSDGIVFTVMTVGTVNVICVGRVSKDGKYVALDQKVMCGINLDAEAKPAYNAATGIFAATYETEWSLTDADADFIGVDRHPAQDNSYITVSVVLTPERDAIQSINLARLKGSDSDTYYALDNRIDGDILYSFGEFEGISDHTGSDIITMRLDRYTDLTGIEFEAGKRYLFEGSENTTVPPMTCTSTFTTTGVTTWLNNNPWDPSGTFRSNFSLDYPEKYLTFLSLTGNSLIGQVAEASGKPFDLSWPYHVGDEAPYNLLSSNSYISTSFTAVVGSNTITITGAIPTSMQPGVVLRAGWAEWFVEGTKVISFTDTTITMSTNAIADRVPTQANFYFGHLVTCNPANMTNFGNAEIELANAFTATGFTGVTVKAFYDYGHLSDRIGNIGFVIASNEPIVHLLNMVSYVSTNSLVTTVQPIDPTYTYYDGVAISYTAGYATSYCTGASYISATAEHIKSNSLAMFKLGVDGTIEQIGMMGSKVPSAAAVAGSPYALANVVIDGLSYDTTSHWRIGSTSEVYNAFVKNGNVFWEAETNVSDSTLVTGKFPVISKEL